MSLEKVGILWSKTDKNKKPMMSGYLSGILKLLSPSARLVVLKNDRKSKDSDPDWSVFISLDTQPRVGEEDEAPF